MPEATNQPLFLCHPFLKAALVTGKFKTIVQHPKYTNINEWVAMNRQSSHDARCFAARSLALTAVFLHPLSVRFLQ